MGRPQRRDNPRKVNLSLSAACREQLGELAGHMSEGRRANVSLSEVVEAAVAELHARRMKPAKAPQRPAK
jgi:hypothetical protein